MAITIDIDEKVGDIRIDIEIHADGLSVYYGGDSTDRAVQE